MSLVINHNLMAMNAARNLSTAYSNLGTSVQRLSSGLRINSAADDAAGLAIRELMRSDITVLNQGIRNASDAISMIQTAEGAMSVIDEKLIRMKELAEQASTGTYTTAQREIMNSEYQAMAAEIDRIANATDFNGVKLLDGSLAQSHDGSGLKVHFGTGNEAAEDYYYVSIGDMRATEGSGLRVGNSDTRDVFTSTSLDFESTSSLMAGSGGTSTGTFGIQTTTDGGTTWNTYGWVTVDDDDTLSDIAHEIGQGPQYTTTLTLGATATSTNLDDVSLTVNGHVFTFDTGTAMADSTVHGSHTTIGLTGGSGDLNSAEEIAEVLSGFINYSSKVNRVPQDVIASTAHGSASRDIVLFSDEFGAPTGSPEISSNMGGGATLSFTSSSWESRDVGNNIIASTVLDENGNYELQLSSSLTGDNNQIRIISPDGYSFNDTGTGMASGASDVDVDQYSAVVSGYMPAYTPLADRADQWVQTQNGEGTTSWDGMDILTQSGAQVALSALDSAIIAKDSARANLGAIQNRLENTITNLQIQAENLQAAESRISDVDVATEMTSFTSSNILTQAANAMLAQANSLPMMALSLLGG